MNSVQADGNHVRGAWQLPKFPGLEARSDVLKPIVIDSDLCVSSGSVAFGFHDRACAQEFVDPQSLRQSGGTPETTGVTPRPTPTPTHTSTQPTPIRPPQVTKPLAVEDTLRLLFSLFVHLGTSRSLSGSMARGPLAGVPSLPQPLAAACSPR